MPTPHTMHPTPPPSIPTGQELYDAIMGHIDPELTTEGLKIAAQQHKIETPEQQSERRKRHTLAFERYDQAYADYIETLQAQVNRFRRDSFGKAEIEDRTHEEGVVQSLARSMFQQAA